MDRGSKKPAPCAGISTKCGKKCQNTAFCGIIAAGAIILLCPAASPLKRQPAATGYYTTASGNDVKK